MEGRDLARGKQSSFWTRATRQIARLLQNCKECPNSLSVGASGSAKGSQQLEASPLKEDPRLGAQVT